MHQDALTLSARLYLLAWDTKKLKVTGAAHLHHLVRAGALAELAQRGLLVDRNGIVTPSDPDARTDDPVLDGLLELVEESLPRKWKTWVALRPRVTLDAVRVQLADAGYLRAGRKRILGFFPATDYALARVPEVDVLRKDAQYVLRGPVPVQEVPERDAAVVALAAAAELRTFVSGRERGEHKRRIEELTERSGAAAPALKRVIQEIRAAVVVAATASSAAGGS